jgi:hypothetical protein
MHGLGPVDGTSCAPPRSGGGASPRACSAGQAAAILCAGKPRKPGRSGCRLGDLAHPDPPAGSGGSRPTPTALATKPTSACRSCSAGSKRLRRKRRVRGRIGDETPFTAFADAIRGFSPDDTLIALRGHDHSGWQEGGLPDQIREYGIAITVFELDRAGRPPIRTCPLGEERRRRTLDHRDAGREVSERPPRVTAASNAQQHARRRA